MSKGTEFTGKTVELATVEAERALAKSRDELEIQVLSQGSRGVFGLGGEPARILARDPNAVEVTEPVAAETRQSAFEPERPQPAAAAESEPRPRPAERPAPRQRSPRLDHTSEIAEANGAAVDVDPVALAASAQEILQTLLSKMGFEVDVAVRDGEDPVTLDVKGENLGVLIGRRGDSLASLQFMVNVILSKEYRTWPQVVIDVQGYRARREQSLSSLGQRVAERVRRNRRPFTLEAMPANDRRIIHMSLRDRSDIETYSIGEGQARRVVIAPKRA